MRVAIDPFLKALKFGRKRALRILHHDQVRSSFYKRQVSLAWASAVLLLCCAASSGLPHEVFACLVLLCTGAGEREARRMRACGRYHQCKRSLEVIGI